MGLRRGRKWWTSAEKESSNFFAFDGDEIEREWRRIMVWSKCHHNWCSGDVWRSAVIDFGCVCSRILWTKFTFSRVKVYVVVWYGDDEERERFWNDMHRIQDRVRNGYRL